MVASGVAVGDGTQVLTVLDYIHSPPSQVSVATTDGTRYQAFVVALDPRTSVTLLRVEGIRLPMNSLGNSQTAIEVGQAISIQGWFRPVVSTEKQDDSIHEASWMLSSCFSVLTTGRNHPCMLIAWPTSIAVWELPKEFIGNLMPSTLSSVTLVRGSRATTKAWYLVPSVVATLTWEGGE